MKNYLLLVSLLMTFSLSLAQKSVRPVDIVQHAAKKYEPTKISMFSLAQEPSKALSQTLDEFVEVELIASALREARKKEHYFVEMELPISRAEKITLQLVPTAIYESNDYYIAEPSQQHVKTEVGTHYRGIIKGDPTSVVALSVFDNEVMGIAAGLYGSNLIIGRVEGSDNHVIYLDDQIAKHNKFTCEVSDDQFSYSEEEINFEQETSRTGPDCVRLYVEVNTDIYNDKGNGTSNFVTGLMNQVMTLYANENINTTLMPLVIWTQSSPYTGNSTSQLLGQFQNYRTSWEGDLGQLLSYRGGGGVAAGFAGICASNRKNSMSYSGIEAYFNTVPTYSWSVELVTHEYGHTFGSRHTHACVWNGNGTAIDGCAGYIEGNCNIPGNPSSGGTIMSYCHQTNVGINFAYGFGTQPGNVIRNRVANGYCLTDCSTDPDPDPNPDCDKNDVVVTINTDNYPGETSWTLTNESGSVVASGASYSNSNSTYTEGLCLDAGCYSFEIKDSYGDGICCGYGNGSYSVTVNGETAATGGSFGTEATHEICTPDPVPSCVDIALKYKTDNYPGEISWTLTNSDGTVVESGENPSLKNNLYTVDGCLDPGCYTLTFYDSYGDGFCCSYGNGYYSFYEGATLKVSQWADFGRTTSHNICVGTGMDMNEIISVTNNIPPFTVDFSAISPFSNTLNIRFEKAKEPIKINSITVVDINGHIMHSEKDFKTNQVLSINSSKWSSGIYYIQLVKDNQTEFIKVMKKY